MSASNDSRPASEEPTIVIDSREELIYLLAEAAEIEHGLMCCYLYAAFSLRRGDPSLEPAEREAVDRWYRAILDVAIDEMLHLALVANLLSSIGSSPHFMRANFPVAAGYHPAGVVVSLAPFDRATLDHFVYLERPEGVALADGAGFAARDYSRRRVAGRLVPSAQDYLTVGHLYRGIRAGFAALAKEIGEEALFAGDPRLQLGPSEVTMEGLTKVSSLADAERAIDTIVRQGEGAPGNHEASHYARFLAVKAEHEAILTKKPSFVAAHPVARNPVMRRPPEPRDKVWVSEEAAATLLDLGNATYALMLRSLASIYSPVALDPEVRATLDDAMFLCMHLLGPLAEKLATMPASDAAPDVHAGLTFTMSRSLVPAADHAGLRVIADLARGVHAGVAARNDPALAHFVKELDAITSSLDRFSTRTAAAAIAPKPAAPVDTSPAAAAAAPGVEIAHGKKLTILFEGKRCIHSRHCVLDAPKVFLANTPGEWIHPDEMSAEALVGIALSCPSGAVRFERHDGGPPESAPPVNNVRVRENGPLAIHAALEIEGRGQMFRATLCRCGESKNKPFCDGSHVAAKFQASGEPATISMEPLAARDGALRVTPKTNGPLQVKGNLEICAGTGRIVNRVTSVAFCRCGHSNKKPFCDGTHAKVGFVADGS